MATAPDSVIVSAEAWEIARIRNGCHPTDGSNLSGKGGLRNNAVGVMGELAVAAALGLEVDREARPDGDPGWDFYVVVNGVGMTIDVKTNTRADPYLLVPAKDIDKQVTLYVLVQLAFGMQRICGWETRGVMRYMPQQDFGSGMLNYWRMAHELRDMAQLVNLLARRTTL